MADPNTVVTYNMLNATYDHLGMVIEKVERAKERMRKEGLFEEYRELATKLAEIEESFGDFMPGLEMDVNGE